MPEFASPLRYPGGKEGLGRLLGRIVELNNIQDSIYAEPYAGGAGAALRLLYGEYVSHIIINDVDYCIIAFWKSVLQFTKRFLNLLENTPVTIDEWQRQRSIYLQPHRHSRLRVGFATFFLNRCNRSGILVDGGPVGGVNQNGKWKLDARYYRVTMRRRIEKIAAYKERISVFNLDAMEFLRSVVGPLAEENAAFVYLDPPYYSKGHKLYLNAYEDGQHEEVARYLQQVRQFKWIMTYDNVAAVRRMYQKFRQMQFSLRYTAHTRRSGRELLICRNDLTLPRQIKPWIALRNITK